MGSPRVPEDVAAIGNDGRPIAIAGDDSSTATLVAKATAKRSDWNLCTLALFSSNGSDVDATIEFYASDGTLIAQCPVAVLANTRPTNYLTNYQMRDGLEVRVWAATAGVVFAKVSMDLQRGA